MEVTTANILIVDDQEYNVSLLERILARAGFKHVRSTMDSYQVERLLTELEPDIILLDLHMPGMDGLDILRMIRQKYGPEQYLPVLMLTADLNTEAKQSGFKAGVNDFLTKPYDRIEVVLRITNLLHTRLLHKQLQQNNLLLEQKVSERTRELEQAQVEILQLLGRAGEYRDDMTGQHTQRVGELSGWIAERIGLSAQDVQMIRLAAPLHDIGKIGIPDNILLKPGRFERDEFELMKSHTSIGMNILEGGSFRLLTLAKTIALSHHEKWDGTGYPQGLKGEEIPLEARIVAIADFYDALTHERPYKKAWTKEETLAEIREQRGKHFDPQLVDVFMQLAVAHQQPV